ncbi:hypothetical protein SKAU_G00356500 [Synaphobranchus kaupii]|uniref:Uncharacterized protein n=1 Tax=Synaphobranchus kaupii TaxID=118154 RepID=A0A9Q1IGN5_SYNKA|nr:hypothetical protein SKAU_G00356500 [Synaphobranchus kaupii]
MPFRTEVKRANEESCQELPCEYQSAARLTHFGNKRGLGDKDRIDVGGKDIPLGVGGGRGGEETWGLTDGVPPSRSKAPQQRHLLQASKAPA